MFSIARALLFILLFIIFSFLFLGIELFRPKERVYADIYDRKDALARWQTKHEGISPGDYPAGRMLAEDYERALVALFRKFPDERENPEYKTEYVHISAVLSRNHPEHIHAIA